jgi:hypothetical protein
MRTRTRARMVEEQDPNFELTPEQEKAWNAALDMVRETITDMGPDWSWLDFGRYYIPHDYQFDSPDFFNFLKKRKYATHHDAQMDGYVPRTKDFFLLEAHLLLRIGTLKGDQKLIADLMTGKTNEGAPLAVKDSSSGYKLVGLREFKVVHLDALAKLRADGSLQRCLDRGVIFEAQSGVYVELIEVYAHPDIAAHLKKLTADSYAQITAQWRRESRNPSVVRRLLNFISWKGARRKVPIFPTLR